MLDKQKILKNANNQEEKIFWAKLIDNAMFCEKKHCMTFSEFSDPYKIGQFMTYAGGGNDMKMLAFGGAENCERLMLGFAPEYEELDEGDFPIDILEISYNKKYSRELTHRDFLGSIIGLGITRGKIGDIIVNEDNAIVFVERSISDYIIANLEKVARTSVKIKNVTGEIEIKSGKEEIKNITVSSLRLDCVLSGAFNISRGKIADYIKAEKVFLNWSEATNASKQTEVGDIITLRGCGRIRLEEIVGKTKKDRILIKICKFT